LAGKTSIKHKGGGIYVVKARMIVHTHGRIYHTALLEMPGTYATIELKLFKKHAFVAQKIMIFGKNWDKRRSFWGV